MTTKNSKPRTKEDRNPFAQSAFAAQCNHAQINNKMEIVPAKTLLGRAALGLILFVVLMLAVVLLVGAA